MRYKFKLVRTILRLLTWRLPVYRLGRAPIPCPERFVAYFSELPPTELLEAFITAYRVGFGGDEVWQEEFTPQDVLTLMREQIADVPASYLVGMYGSTNEVAGLCWGAVLFPEDVPGRVVASRYPGRREYGLRLYDGLVGALARYGLRTEKLLYIDELLVLPRWRSGLSPIQFLIRPGLELGYQQEARAALFLTSPRTNVVSLAVYMGFEPLWVPEDGYVFMYTPDYWPILRLAQNLDARAAARVMSWTSKIRPMRRRR